MGQLRTANKRHNRAILADQARARLAAAELAAGATPAVAAA